MGVMGSKIKVLPCSVENWGSFHVSKFIAGQESGPCSYYVTYQWLQAWTQELDRGGQTERRG